MKAPNLKKPKLLIHLGYHKTATTFWQQQVFKSASFNLIDRKQVQQQLLSKTPYSYKSNQFNQWLEKHLVAGQINVISDEEFSGNIHTGGNGRSITYEVIERLSKITVADVYVLVFFRAQPAMIESCYRHYVKNGGCFKLKDYIFSENKGARRHRFPAFSLEHLQYHDVVEHLYRGFNSNQVLTLPYELFVQDPELVYSKLSSLLSIELFLQQESNNSRIINKSLSNLSLILARISNRFSTRDPICRNSIIDLGVITPAFRLIYKWIDRVLPESWIYHKLLSKELDNYVINYFSESNRHLELLLGYKLEKYGYKFAKENEHSSKL